MYLQQLGKTPFLKKQKPTPYDEAISLLWFLENVFYPASGRILSNLKNTYADYIQQPNPLVRLASGPAVTAMAIPL
jgi:phosphoenolpyruvate carboxylase